MTQKTFFSTTLAIFSAIGVLHLLRLVSGWEAVIGGWAVPLWVSGLALLLAFFLAYSSYKLLR